MGTTKTAVATLMATAKTTKTVAKKTVTSSKRVRDSIERVKQAALDGRFAFEIELDDVRVLHVLTHLLAGSAAGG
jgi:hypothetical protein